MQQYLVDHRHKMKTVYKIVHDESFSNRVSIMTRQNRDREPEKEYEIDQDIYIKNPAASRQKLAPRYTSDKVIANLPIHIYTSKKKGPVAKHRLKRDKKNNNSALLQDPRTRPRNDDEPGPSRDPT